jgi:REP element-mobilizing transposase RayT
MHTKGREHLIRDEADGARLAGFMIAKARELDAYLEESGCWRDHVHILLRCGTGRAISEVYGQLKGFSWAAWRKHLPERPFRWGDGVFIATVDPDRNQELREYIRGQWERHERRALVAEWEHVDLPAS